MIKYIILLTFTAIVGELEAQSKQPELNVVYGDRHIFTIETPDGWVNDKEYAQSIGLVDVFYAKSDSRKGKKSYMYAQGYDKDPGETLVTFVKNDLKSFRKKYPDFKYDSTRVDAPEPILDAKMLSFSNLKDRYKEEVVYMETADNIIVFSFAAFTASDYEAYTPVFDKFLSSFIYRGNDPKPYLDFMQRKK